MPFSFEQFNQLENLAADLKAKGVWDETVEQQYQQLQQNIFANRPDLLAQKTLRESFPDQAVETDMMSGAERQQVRQFSQQRQQVEQAQDPDQATRRALQDVGYDPARLDQLMSTDVTRGKEILQEGRNIPTTDLSPEAMGRKLAESRPDTPGLAGAVAGVQQIATGNASLINRVMGRQQEANELLTERNVAMQDLGGLDQKIAGAVDSVSTYLATALGGPVAIYGTFASKAMNEAAKKGQDKGLTGADLGEYVAGQGAIELAITAIFHKAGMGGLEAGRRSAVQGMKGALKRFGFDTITEVGEEGAIAITSAVHDRLAGVDLNELTGGRIADIVKDTTLQTIATMGLARGLQGHPTRRAPQEPQAQGPQGDTAAPAQQPAEPSLSPEQQAFQDRTQKAEARKVAGRALARLQHLRAKKTGKTQRDPVTGREVTAPQAALTAEEKQELQELEPIETDLQAEAVAPVEGEITNRAQMLPSPRQIAEQRATEAQQEFQQAKQEFEAEGITSGQGAQTIVVNPQQVAGTQGQHQAGSELARQQAEAAKQQGQKLLPAPPPQTGFIVGEQGTMDVRPEADQPQRLLPAPEADPRFVAGEEGVRDRGPLAEQTRRRIPERRAAEGPMAEGRQRVDALTEQGEIEKRDAEIARLQKALRTESKTGLGNEFAWTESLENLQKKAKRSQKGQSFVWFDAANLKAANDFLGHEGADRILIDIANTMDRVAKEELGENVTVTRQGGDEFGIVAPGLTRTKAATIMKKVEQEIGQQEITPGVSMFMAGGVGTIPAEGGISQAVAEADDMSETRKRQLKTELGEPLERSEAEAVIQRAQQAQRETVISKGSRGLPAFDTTSVMDQTAKIDRLKALKKRARDKEAEAAQARAEEMIQDIAKSFSPRNQRPGAPDYTALSESDAKQIAQAYEEMVSNPDDPAVVESYNALKAEVLEQFDQLEKAGFRFELAAMQDVADFYPSVNEMKADILANKRLKVNADPGDMNPDHPLMEEVEGKPGWNYNHIFRAVHDFFGHAQKGHSFTIEGEENAWRDHRPMFSDAALGALTTETRGQSSWVGYGPQGKANRRAVAAGKLGDVQFPEQKIGLLPKKFWQVNPSKADTDVTFDPNVQDKTPSDHMTEAADQLPLVEFAGEWLSENGTYKRPEEWIRGKREAKAEETIIQERGIKWAEKFGQAVKRAGIDLADRATALEIHKTLQGRRSMESWPASIRPLLAEWRTLMDNASKEYANVLEQAGMADAAEAVRNNIGKYTKSVPTWTLTTRRRVVQALKDFRKGLGLTQSFGKFKRDQWVIKDGKKFVTKFETEEQADAFLKEQGKRSMHKVPPRTEAERDAEDVHDPRYILNAGLAEATHNAQMIKLHLQVAETYKVDPPEGLEPGQIETWAEENGLVELPNHNKFHRLNGVYVPEGIGKDLTEMSDAPSGFEQFLRGYFRAWKKGIIVYNPATHVRNVLGNSLFFAPLAGVAPANPANYKYYSQAIRSMGERGDVWEDMIRNDVLGGEYYGAEIEQIKRAITDPADAQPGFVLAMAGKIDRGFGRLYSFEDAIFKAAAYHKYIDQGMEPEEAGAEVNKWFPNYDRTSKLSKKLSQHWLGMPFASFLDQSVRIAGRAVKERPLRLTMMLSMPGLLDWISKILMGITEEEERVLRAKQGYIESYFTPFLPWRDSKGHALSADFRYIFPLVNDVVPKARDNGALYIPWFANGPLATTAVEQLSGKDVFTGKTLDEASEKGSALLDNTLPLPYIVKELAKSGAGAAGISERGGRISRTFNPEDKTREDTAYAIIGAIAGMNARRPYVAQDDVIDSAARAIVDGDRKLSNKMLRIWNNQYRPPYFNRLTTTRINNAVKKLQEE